MRVLAIVVVGILAGVAAAHIVERRLESHPAGYDWTRARFSMLTMKMDAFARDLHRLPATLDEMLASDAKDWRGPYAQATDLVDPRGTPIRYEIIRAETFDFRLVIERHCPANASQKCSEQKVWDSTSH
jgi:hypothetical protein